jgi:hypothetical protein
MKIHYYNEKKAKRFGVLLFLLAMLKLVGNFATMLIGAEGARLLENAIAFPSCDVISKKLFQSPAGKTGQGRPRRRKASAWKRKLIHL